MSETKPVAVQRIRTRVSVIWAFVMLVGIHVMPLVVDTTRNTVAAAIFVGTCISLYSSIAFWLGFGEKWWRVIGVGLLVIWVTAVLRNATGGSADWEGFLLLLFFGGIVIATVVTPIAVVRQVRSGKLRVVNDSRDYRNEAMQFGITQMLAFTTVVAVLIMIAKVVIPLIDSAGQGWQLVARLATALGCCSVIVIWSTLGKNALARMLASTLSGTGMAALNFWFVDGSGGWLWVVVTVVVWIEITMLMWLVRLEGYRFVSVRPIVADGIAKADSDK